MALQKTTETQFGVQVTDAYIRVDAVQIEQKNASAIVRFYKDQFSTHFRQIEIGFLYNLTGDNPIKQAYEHLKTLPEFSDATDC